MYRLNEGLPKFTLSSYFQTQGTKDFLAELEKSYDRAQLIKTSRGGKSKGTWVHPLIFVDIALTISPKLKVEVYKWVQDGLLKYRNASGDSYKTMCGHLYQRCSPRRFPAFITKAALQIKDACGVEDWQTATEDQLTLRDRMQDNITPLSDVLTSPENAVELGIMKTLENQSKSENKA